MRYLAFLRAINVGKHNRIRMADLRDKLETAGLQNPKTYLQSGNVWFDSNNPDLEALSTQFEDLLVSLGCKGADVMLRSLEQMQAMQKLQPFAQTPPEHYQFVVFLRQPISEIVTGHARLEVVYSTGSEVFLQLNKTIPANKVSSMLKTKIPHTARYWNVVEEMYELMQG